MWSGGQVEIRAIVVGSGAGGATAARELAINGIEVMVLESGRPFRPFTRRLSWAGPLRRAGLLGGGGNISLFFPHMRTLRASKDLVLVWGETTGGCTAIACGNIARAEKGLSELGLDLTPEFVELEGLMKPLPFPRERWRPLTRRMYDAAESMELKPAPTPKALDPGSCIACGLCELGCASGAKWDSRHFLTDAVSKGAVVRSDSPVTRVLVEHGRVRGVETLKGGSPAVVKAEVVVLAAGGIGTARILRASGLPVRDNLWSDVVLTVGGQSPGARMLEEPPMAWFSRRKDYIISPYFDVLSHWFHEPWRDVSASRRVGVMVKLAESEVGTVNADGTVDKELTGQDRDRLDEGAQIAQSLMEEAGVSGPFVRGMLNGGHLGGTSPLTRKGASSMRPPCLPEGLWVADLSLLHRSQGFPTILIASALSLRVSRRILESTRF